jgi:hypothetical protein
MKKTLLLTLALGVAGASSLKAVDIYITGATAFRANVYDACRKLFNPNLASPGGVYFGDAAHGGAGSGFANSTAVWAMKGQPLDSLTNKLGSTMTIHGNFTGSVQGIQTTEQGTLLTWANADGVLGGNCATYSTNAPTLGFSDADAASTPFPVPAGFLQEAVAVQPFVVMKSTAGTGPVTNINNVTWEQLEYGIPAGRIPLSAWTGNTADTNTFIYIVERTRDSGTRRNFTQGQYYQFNDPAAIYLFDYTNHFWYQSTNLTSTANGASPNGVVGPAGLNNANLSPLWGSGYVGGGDIKNTLNNNNVANQSIAYLSIADAKSVGSSNWATMVTYNGLWPTGAGAGIHGNTATNTDYSPITKGYYPLYGNEVLIHYEPVNPAVVIPGQNITGNQLGDNTGNFPGSFMSVFNAQSYLNSGTVTAGSVENEIVLSQSTAGGATGIPLAQMINSRPNVGGTIFPPFQ